MLATFKQRLIRDMKASPAKTAVLGVLLLVGLWFWVPPLYRLVAGSSHTTPPRPNPKALVVAQPTVARTTPTRAPGDSQAIVDWQGLCKTIASEPLLSPCSLDELARDPFVIDRNHWSPPILFAEEVANDTTEKTAKKRPTEPPKLTGTIEGTSRRAAYIDGKMYFEGEEIVIGGRPWKLERIAAGRVILSQGRSTLVLTLDEPDSTSGIHIAPVAEATAAP